MNKIIRIGLMTFFIAGGALVFDITKYFGAFLISSSYAQGAGQQDSLEEERKELGLDIVRQRGIIKRHSKAYDPADDKNFWKEHGKLVEELEKLKKAYTKKEKEIDAFVKKLRQEQKGRDTATRTNPNPPWKHPEFGTEDPRNITPAQMEERLDAAYDYEKYLIGKLKDLKERRKENNPPMSSSEQRALDEEIKKVEGEKEEATNWYRYHTDVYNGYQRAYEEGTGQSPSDRKQSPFNVKNYNEQVEKRDDSVADDLKVWKKLKEDYDKLKKKIDTLVSKGKDVPQKYIDEQMRLTNQLKELTDNIVPNQKFFSDLDKEFSQPKTKDIPIDSIFKGDKPDLTDDWNNLQRQLKEEKNRIHPDPNKPVGTPADSDRVKELEDQIKQVEEKIKEVKKTDAQRVKEAKDRFDNDKEKEQKLEKELKEQEKVIFKFINKWGNGNIDNIPEDKRNEFDALIEEHTKIDQELNGVRTDKAIQENTKEQKVSVKAWYSPEFRQDKTEQESGVEIAEDRRLKEEVNKVERAITVPLKSTTERETSQRSNVADIRREVNKKQEQKPVDLLKEQPQQQQEDRKDIKIDRRAPEKAPNQPMGRDR